MWGMMVKVRDGADEKEKWCSFAYEFLPDFFYVCGHIGHIDKHYGSQVEKGEPNPFSRSLRYIPEKKKSDSGEERRSWSMKPHGQWFGGSSSGRNFYEPRGDKWGSSGHGSGALSWRKSAEDSATEKGDEVTSPLKELHQVKEIGGGVKKVLLSTLEEKKGTMVVEPKGGKVDKGDGKKSGKGSEREGKKGGEKEGAKNFGRSTHRRMDKNRPVSHDNKKEENLEKKRKMEIDGEENGKKEGVKKAKGGSAVAGDQYIVENEAGPADRSRETQ
jgi:hypothetical protein